LARTTVSAILSAAISHPKSSPSNFWEGNAMRNIDHIAIKLCWIGIAALIFLNGFLLRAEWPG